VINYPIVSDANIRMCIVTVYNCILLVKCINFFFELEGNFIT